MASFTEMTRKQLSENIRLMETGMTDLEKFKALFDVSPDPMLLMTGTCNILYCNRSVAELYDYPVQKLCLLSLVDIVTEETTVKLPELLSKETISGGLIIEALNRKSDGETFHAMMILKPIKINGEIYRSMFVRDLSKEKTEKKKTERVSA